MMKIFTTDQLKRLDTLTIQNEPISSIDLMERAAQACFNWIISRFSQTSHFTIFAGPGNNGGDGLALARMLVQEGYFADVFLLAFNKTLSEECAINKKRLEELTVKLNSVDSLDEEINFKTGTIIIDSIFGSGLSRAVAEPFKRYITLINGSDQTVISIDLPSGLFADHGTDVEVPSIQATHTLTFEAPKLALFFPENNNRVGEWHILPIGLCPKAKNDIEVKQYYQTLEAIRPLVKMRAKFGHKGTYGHATILAGSLGKIGAAILAGKACLRSGVGLLTMYIPRCGYGIAQTAVPEAMVELNTGQDFLEGKWNPSNKTTAVGPGMGQEAKTVEFLKDVLIKSNTPLIIDADAINMLSQHKSYFQYIPAKSIITPHPKEFTRMAGPYKSDVEKIEMQKSFSVEFNCYVVLKGAHTSISDPNGNLFFNSTGNPGMATAGSGDVLTGIITGLLAQGYNSLEACQIGVFIHGLAGDLAAIELSPEALIASDIVRYLGKAWKFIH